MNREKPIGYWLKLCNDLLERYVTAQQAENGIDRLDWQLLNVIRSGMTEPAQIFAELSLFAPSVTLEARLLELQNRGLLQASHEFTERGEAAFSKFAETQDHTRAVVTAGVSEESYETAIAVLKQVAGNLRNAGA